VSNTTDEASLIGGLSLRLLLVKNENHYQIYRPPYFPAMSLAPMLAHVGHWYMWLLYAVPVLVVIAASLHALLDQRREDRRREAEHPRGS
jgi:hypothetical protein